MQQPNLSRTPLSIALCLGALALHMARQRQSLGGELQGALRRGEFTVHYQPIVDLNTRQCVGAEALIRWRHADGTMTSPELFIPVAESTATAWWCATPTAMTSRSASTSLRCVRTTSKG